MRSGWAGLAQQVSGQTNAGGEGSTLGRETDNLGSCRGQDHMNGQRWGAKNTGGGTDEGYFGKAPLEMAVSL